MNSIKSKVIYGAGYWGRLAFFQYGSDAIQCFVDSDRSKRNTKIYGKYVLTIDDINREYDIIIAVQNKKSVEDIKDLLVKRGFSYQVFDPGDTDSEYYYIDGLKLKLGEDHQLPLYQVLHGMYDRFTPLLAECANEVCVNGDANNWIIDVGANVGDTTAAMIKRTKGNIVCVEPTEPFYTMLRENINGWGEDLYSRIRLVKAYISDNCEEHFSSDVKKGTATKVYVKSGKEGYNTNTMTLPMVFDQEKIDYENISVIKTDTDGYDADCILSLGDFLYDYSPLLFCENSFVEIRDSRKYNEMLNLLEKSMYEYFFVFDNFGNYLAEFNVSQVRSIYEYLMRIENGYSTRTFYYVDILICKKNKVEICRKKIRKYCEAYK